MDRLRNFIVADASRAGVRAESGPRGRVRRRRLETRPFRLTRGGVERVEERRRTLGAVLVPGKHLVRVEAAADDVAVADARGGVGALGLG